MHLPRGRDLDFVGHGRDLSDYPEGSVSLWGEFWAVVWPFDILSFQPDFVSYFESFKLCFLDHAFLCLFEGSLRLFSCVLDCFDSCFDVGDGGVSVGLMCQWDVA